MTGALFAAIAGSVSVSCVETPDKVAAQHALPAPPLPVVPLDPTAASMRRLLKRQYVNSIRSFFGTAAAAVAAPPDDATVDGFEAIGARQLSLSDSAVSAYESSARSVAEVAMKNTARMKDLLGCEPKGPTDAACHTSLVTKLGRLVFRRPLTEAEVTRYVGVAQSAAQELDSFDAGTQYVISALLQSPHFLYMVEVGEPLDEGRSSLTDYELLSRMSYFLLDSTPDEVLLDLVKQEGLNSDDQIRFVASAMLERLDARSALSSFYAELYRLRDLDGMVKDADLYPAFTPSLAASMRQETLKLIDDVIWERDADFREIFSANYTFVNAELAAFYGVKGPAGGAFEKVVMPPEQARDGALGHASLLARFSHVGMTSPTLRGKFVREKILCGTIPPPPPDVSTSLPEPDPNAPPKTMKQKLIEHQQNPSCAYCHVLMDNIGLAFEKFDPTGAYRTMDMGLPIDTLTSTKDLGAFSSPKELGAILKDDPNVAMCLVKNLYRSALGHIETKGELEAVNNIAFSFADSGFRVRELLVDMVASPAFRIVGVPQ
jgi:hypothetical protein